MLSKNPHYKPTAQQQQDIDKHVSPEPEYGVLPKHNTAIPKHPTEPIKKKRSSKEQV